MLEHRFFNKLLGDQLHLQNDLHPTQLAAPPNATMNRQAYEMPLDSGSATIQQKYLAQ
jgi:hypothetical protein